MTLVVIVAAVIVALDMGAKGLVSSLSVFLLLRRGREHPEHKGGGHGLASLDFPQQHLESSLASRPGYIAWQALRSKHELSVIGFVRQEPHDTTHQVTYTSKPLPCSSDMHRLLSLVLVAPFIFVCLAVVGVIAVVFATIIAVVFVRRPTRFKEMQAGKRRGRRRGLGGARESQRRRARRCECWYCLGVCFLRAMFASGASGVSLFLCVCASGGENQNPVVENDARRSPQA